MNKKEVLKKAKGNEYIIKSYNEYKNLCSNFVITEKTLKEYIQELLNIFEEEINYKSFICDDDILNDYEYSNLIKNKKDFLEEETTQDLKQILKKDYYEYFDLSYHEQHLFIEEDLTQNLNLSKKQYQEYFKVSGYHDSILYFVYNQDKIDYYKEDKINDNINNLINIDLEYFNIYLIISNNENRFNHKQDNNTDINKEYEELREMIKIELYNRMEKINKDLKTKFEELSKIKTLKEDKEEINKINLKKHSIINNCVFGYEEKINKDIEELKQELKEIISF